MQQPRGLLFFCPFTDETQDDGLLRLLLLLLAHSHCIPGFAAVAPEIENNWM